MDTWSLPKARPISCNDCPAFQRDHMSVRWFAESFTRLPCVINTTFREEIYIRWCCNDRLSWHRFSGLGRSIDLLNDFEEGSEVFLVSREIGIPLALKNQAARFGIMIASRIRRLHAEYFVGSCANSDWA